MKGVVLVGVVATLAGCGGPDVRGLRTRAAFDMNCPEDQLQLVELSGQVYGVSGCNKRATYVGEGNSWTDNSGAGARDAAPELAK